jgi:hypothetical protein
VLQHSAVCSYPVPATRCICSSRLASETIYHSLQGPLSSTQWITELSGWFSVGLAAIQQAALEYATGPQYLGATGKLVPPAANDTLGHQLCHSQTFRSSGEVQSFSLLGIVIILFVGGLIILVSFCLETVVGWFQKTWSKGDDRRIQWERDDKLELLARESSRTPALEMRRQRHDFTDHKQKVPADLRTGLSIEDEDTPLNGRSLDEVMAYRGAQPHFFRS